MTGPATSSHEKPVFLPAGGQSLLGILTSPTSEPNGRVVIFLAGGGHAFLYRRIAVRLSRRLAAWGFHGFRFDYHGLGDSSGETTLLRLDEPFVEDLRGAIQWLRAQGFERFIIVAHCFGARTALACAPEIEGLERLLLVDLQVRDLEQGEAALKVPDTTTYLEIARRAARPDVLRRLLDARNRRFYRTYLQKRWGVEIARLRARAFPSRSQGIASRLLLDLLARVIEVNLPLTLLFAENARSYREFVEARRGSLGRMLDRAGDTVRVRTVEGKGFQEVDGQDRILDIVVGELQDARATPRVG